MQDLIHAIISGAATATNSVKSMGTTPMLFCEDFEIPLETVTHRQHGTAKVAQYPLIMTGSNVTRFVTNNVAPMPWEWYLSGYIPGFPPLEPSNLFTPFLIKNVDNLRKAFEDGRVLFFKDIDCTIYKTVAIQSLDIDWKGEVKNKIPFSMVLKELVIVKTAEVKLTPDELAVTPQEGTKDGQPNDLGNTASEKVITSEMKNQGNNYKAAGMTAGSGLPKK